MLITEQEIEKLKSAKNETEWNLICDEIKAIRGNEYPSDWFSKVNASGIMSEVFHSWNS